jgi:hypothetical protein
MRRGAIRSSADAFGHRALNEPVLEKGALRPLWSVHDIHISLREVFASDAGACVVARSGSGRHADRVVADCPNDNTASEVTRRLGAGRLTFHAQSQNQGLANNWNRCVE